MKRQNFKQTKTGLIYPKKGTEEAYEWADRMQKARKAKKKHKSYKRESSHY